MGRSFDDKRIKKDKSNGITTPLKGATPIDPVPLEPTPESKSLDITPLDQVNWEKVQREIRLKVAEAMEGFYSMHSKAWVKMQQLIQEELLPKLERNAMGDLKEITELMRRLIVRVENLRSDFELHWDMETSKKNRKSTQKKDDIQSLEPYFFDVIYQNPRCISRATSEREFLRESSPQSEDESTLEEHQLFQFQVNQAFVKKSMISMYLNRKSCYCPIHNRTKRNHGPIHQPRDLVDIYD
ncbi:uncharacterized protein LOC108103817 [Drosophila eugracilis]|uniref:uncharacterized protein LOC108103817 n=1 Tax=Drosophila eugracilis TaxID=29029 RepID=UPI0007E8A00F|nr:uncharacterized protein LOC108103817 [Drosophila eugracilis]